jgi:hypothetical protein
MGLRASARGTAMAVSSCRVRGFKPSSCNHADGEASGDSLVADYIEQRLLAAATAGENPLSGARPPRGARRAQFCTEVAHPEQFERPIPNSSFAGWHRRWRTMLHADPNIVGRCWQDGMLGIPSRKQLAPFISSRRAHESR